MMPVSKMTWITREWGMVVNYPKTEAVVLGPVLVLPMPAAFKLDPTAWQSGLSSSLWAALCRQTGGRTRSQEVMLRGKVFRSLEATLCCLPGG